MKKILFLFWVCGFSYAQDAKVVKRYVNDSIHFDMTSSCYAPLLITIASRKVADSLSGFTYKEKFLLPSFDTIPSIISVPETKFTDSTKISLGDYFKFLSYYGDPDNSKHDSNYLYTLPFKKGKKYEITQSFFGKFSHNHKASFHAIDFKLKIGDPVYAAREGIVIKTIDKYTKHGGKSFRDKANKILIMHDDGTIASYVHLDYKGVLVKEGERAERGQKIGISGFTGYTSGPHLHFVVREFGDVSVPIYFEGYEGLVLKQGKRYKRKK
ncbi:MAG: M23 family metallopeptidase [Flavobacteriaceae bacterium]|nr:M23 family metallopeptidase [Flavobacteriaceae bacterium]